MPSSPAPRPWTSAPAYLTSRKMPPCFSHSCGITPATEKAKRTWSFFPTRIDWRLFTKYLQQLVMESLGKEKNLAGEIVHQGIAVYGNKGSTDQHSYVQQLRDGVLNFFVTFVEVRNDRRGARFEVEDGITSGDYLAGISARDPQRVVRERTGINYDEHSRGERILRRSINRAL